MEKTDTNKSGWLNPTYKLSCVDLWLGNVITKLNSMIKKFKFLANFFAAVFLEIKYLTSLLDTSISENFTQFQLIEDKIW